ncbi:MAG: type II toxin-antitoxin system tRNA(fMet)-specific endonuclease VapC [Endozoicomonas sp.]|uniref:type II toxin-antitoxin system tRNA(fMet)-specific endonuclease VapC n=1 Tax=Endozoicomonas sp. TaxID=1892382 RepID=UPI003D9B7411
MISYLLDTCTCIYTLNNRPKEVAQALTEHINSVAISALTYYELMYGAFQSNNPDRQLKAIEAFTALLPILSFDQSAAKHSGNVRSELKKLGTPIGPVDTLIAGHALSLNLTVVTNNTKEFERVSELQIENWVNT